MLWQCHQDTEIVFVDCLWPQFDIWKFLPILTDWAINQKKKNAGKVQDEQNMGLESEREIPVR